MTHFLLMTAAVIQIALACASANAGNIDCKQFGMVKHPVHGRYCIKPELLPKKLQKLVKNVKVTQ